MRREDSKSRHKHNIPMKRGYSQVPHNVYSLLLALMIWEMPNFKSDHWLFSVMLFGH